jgi:putative FmdB family regulatory protein
MPTYDYQCDSCGHKFELFQSIKDEAIRKCPQCKKLKLRRLFGTGAALVFKGSGFHQTDYRSEAYKKAAKADAASGESKSTGDGASQASTDGACSGDKSSCKKCSD